MSVLLNGKRIEVIDAHVHTFPDTVAPAAVGKLEKISGLTPSTDGTVAQTLAKMEECGVDRAVFLNIATSPKQQTTINNCAAQLSRELAGRVTSFGSVHVLAEDALDELQRIKSLGLRGIKLHPDYQGFLIDDERLYPIYDACAELDLPIVFHSGWDCYSPELIHAPPQASRRVLDHFPKLKMVLAHFGGLKLWDDVEEYLVGQNVWFDTAMCATYADPAQIERMILRHGPDKVFLGSDCPWENPARSIEFLLSLNLSDAAKEAILSANLKAFLRW